MCIGWHQPLYLVNISFDFGQPGSRVAQWKRAGPISDRARSVERRDTQRSVDRNHALLTFFFFVSLENIPAFSLLLVSEEGTIYYSKSSTNLIDYVDTALIWFFFKLK